MLRDQPAPARGGIQAQREVFVRPEQKPGVLGRVGVAGQAGGKTWGFGCGPLLLLRGGGAARIPRRYRDIDKLNRPALGDGWHMAYNRPLAIRTVRRIGS
jgi:hypothetical protein